MKIEKRRNCLWALAVVMLWMVLVTGCRTRPAPVHPSVYERVGLASYYGKRFHGRKTASGERYNMHAMTAAHKHLAFGTFVRVTHLKNGRSVRVRINDRGPFVKGRIIDLSHAAAKKLKMISQGVAKVRLRVDRK